MLVIVALAVLFFALHGLVTRSSQAAGYGGGAFFGVFFCMLLGAWLQVVLAFAFAGLLYVARNSYGGPSRPLTAVAYALPVVAVVLLFVV